MRRRTRASDGTRFPGQDAGWEPPGRGGARSERRSRARTPRTTPALAGRLDLATARRADRALRATQADAPLVVLDLRRVQVVGCTAARLALMADARARRELVRASLIARPPGAVAGGRYED